MVKAEVVAHSSNEFGKEIATMVVTFPRIILAEFNTHRMFSRNSASSRAIPFEKMVKSVEENPFIPIAWQKDHKGMQGTEYLNQEDSFSAIQAWEGAKRRAIEAASFLNTGGGVTKQLANRLLEPFMWHTVIVTATEWENFFALRCPKYVVHDTEFLGGTGKDFTFRSKRDAVEHFPSLNGMDTDTWLRDFNKGPAEIHMMALAEAMWDALNESVPKELKAGEWHIPFGDNINNQDILDTMVNLRQVVDNRTLEDPGGDPDKALGETMDKGIIKIATARCARVSYTVVGEEDKKDNYENDIKLHDRLLASGHMSPFEHCAKASNCSIEELELITGGAQGNFTGGWLQYRKMIPNENITKHG